MGVSHFGGAPQGLPVSDAASPSGEGGVPVPVGYPGDIMVVGTPGALVEALDTVDDLDIIELGTIPASGHLRLGRVRYRFLTSDSPFTIHSVDMGKPGFEISPTELPLPSLATGAVAGIPGHFTPAGVGIPPNAGVVLDGSWPLVADPLTDWTVGQYVECGDQSIVHWMSGAWTPGDVEAVVTPPPVPDPCLDQPSTSATKPVLVAWLEAAGVTIDDTSHYTKAELWVMVEHRCN